MNWNVKRFSMLNIAQVILVRTDSNLCRKELTVHWGAPNSLIRSYFQPCTNSMWRDESEAVAPIIWLYQTVDARKEEIFFQDLLITLRRHVGGSYCTNLNCNQSRPNARDIIWKNVRAYILSCINFILTRWMSKTLCVQYFKGIMENMEIVDMCFIRLWCLWWCTNGRLANLELTSVVKEATWLYSPSHKTSYR